MPLVTSSFRSRLCPEQALRQRSADDLVKADVAVADYERCAAVFLGGEDGCLAQAARE